MGRARGATLIGRPLNVTVPVALDEGEGACFDAELYFGETRAEKPVLQWEPGTDAQGQVRLLTRQLVDEPMVTVYLTAGCRNRITRRYVLLSEQPPDVEPAPRPPALAGKTAAPGVLPPPAAPFVPPPKVAGEGKGKADATRPVAPTPVRPAVRRTGEARAATDVRPRLRLEPPDLEPQVRLRLDPGLRTAPGGDPQARQQAASLWRALNTTPEQAVQEADRLRALESDVAALKDSSRQTAAALTLMVEQLEKARRERNQVALVFVLFAALVVLAAGAAGGLWWARRGRLDRPASPWHRAPAGAGEPLPEAEEADVGGSRAGRVSAAPATTPPATRTAPSGSAPEKGLEAGPPGHDVRAAAEPGKAVRADAPDTLDRLDELVPAALAPHLGYGRVVGVEELMDIEDKAAFFVSIGQHDQAMAVLESHVHDEVETSALPWLDLLELYHQFDRRDDYERLRREFIARFNAEVPGFDAFGGASGGLQDYPRALTRIVSLWPTPKVLDVIEESIFRKPDAPGAEAFSLEAYRELLLLYHLAREVVPRAAEPPPFRSTDFISTALEPLSASTQAAAESGRVPLTGDRVPPLLQLADLDIPDLDLPALEPPKREVTDREIPQLQIPPASPRLGLDVDLAEIEVEAHAQTELSPGLEFNLEWDPHILAANEAPDRPAKP